jgi:uncharacterized membrane protein HdeD (DUF308 family)
LVFDRDQRSIGADLTVCLEALGAAPWAVVSGAAQLAVALRRRAVLGRQWPMLIAGSFSMFAGIAYVLASTGADPKLRMIAIYAATGGADFVIEAWLLARRRRRIATLPAQA